MTSYAQAPKGAVIEDSNGFGRHRWQKWGPGKWFRVKKGPDGREWYLWAPDELVQALEAYWRDQNPAPATLF